MSDLSRQHGQVFETYIRSECRDLNQKAGRARVQKNWEAPKVPGEHMRIEPSKPDFSGFLTDGRHVMFEAKATLSKTSFPFGSITDHQWEYLDWAHTVGSIVFVYVLDGLRRKWVIPWARVLECKAYRESFPFEILDFSKSKGETWLDAWMRLEERELT